MYGGMAQLLRDRYYEYAPDRGWDLLTGQTVRFPAEDPEPRGGGRTVLPLVELLDHGSDGSPRWIVVQPTHHAWVTQAQAFAAEARRRGYVPIGVDVFLRTRLLLADALSTRALLLIGRPGSPVALAEAALLHAAALSPRPHVLMTCSARVRARASSQWRVAEARAVYGSRPLHAAPPQSMPTDVARLIERARRAQELVLAGRHASAERLLREVAGALVRRRELTAAAETYIQLGRLVLERGRVRLADEAFGEAAQHAETAGSALLAATRIWQAAARTDAGQLSSAESLCRAVMLTSQLDDEQRLNAEATLARVLLWQGRSAEARSLPFVSSRGPSTPPFAVAMAVRVLLASGELFEAGQQARELLTNATTADPITWVIALGAHLRLLLVTGDLTLAAARFEEFAAAARRARSPLRVVRMRLLFVQALRRAGRAAEANRELRMLVRMRAPATPLLRAAIDRCTRDSSAPAVERGHPQTGPMDGAELVMLAQREEDDRHALKRICDFVLRTLGGTRVELWTGVDNAATAVVTSGSGLPARLGLRALEAGIVVGPESVDSGSETAVPVRLGPKLIGALATRWPADRTPSADSVAVLTLASAVAAPRVDSMLQAQRHAVVAATSIPELVGVSATIADVRRTIVRAGAAPFSVLIEGESGVGKELVARAIHQLSPRRERRFCDVNCAALPDDLIESELFGHAKGAFTGAVIDRCGLVEEADGGTLFLDEVADLSARAQAKLLRVVQQQEIRRIGETFSRKVDVRFVSAANRNLRDEAGNGRFRDDLLYRLDVIRIHIPPLRERPEDIPVLAQHFWAAASARVGTRATLSHAVLAALARYHWPGNVRELQNVLAALAVEAPGRGQVSAAKLPAAITGASVVSSGRLSEARTQWERRFVEVALARAGGNRARAARELGLTRQGLLKVIERLTNRPSTSRS